MFHDYEVNQAISPDVFSRVMLSNILAKAQEYANNRDKWEKGYRLDFIVMGQFLLEACSGLQVDDDLNRLKALGNKLIDYANTEKRYDLVGLAKSDLQATLLLADSELNETDLLRYLLNAVKLKCKDEDELLPDGVCAMYWCIQHALNGVADEKMEWKSGVSGFSQRWLSRGIKWGTPGLNVGTGIAASVYNPSLPIMYGIKGLVKLGIDQATYRGLEEKLKAPSNYFQTYFAIRLVDEILGLIGNSMKMTGLSNIENKTQAWNLIKKTSFITSISGNVSSMLKDLATVLKHMCETSLLHKGETYIGYIKDIITGIGVIADTLAIGDDWLQGLKAEGDIDTIFDLLWQLLSLLTSQD